jgi:hypothetical protein
MCDAITHIGQEVFPLETARSRRSRPPVVARSTSQMTFGSASAFRTGAECSDRRMPAYDGQDDKAVALLRRFLAGRAGVSSRKRQICARRSAGARPATGFRAETDAANGAGRVGQGGHKHPEPSATRRVYLSGAMSITPRRQDLGARPISARGRAWEVIPRNEVYRINDRIGPRTRKT